VSIAAQPTKPGDAAFSASAADEKNRDAKVTLVILNEFRIDILSVYLTK
jgi:hypothetical protein